MSENNAEKIDELPLTDELVASFLQDNPDFFNRNPALLSSLKLNDPHRGVVSLVERQQLQLREKVHSLEEEITQLLTVANHNEQLFIVYNDLYMGLIDCESVEQIIDRITETATELLSLSSVKLYLNFEPEKAINHSALISKDCQSILDNRFDREEYYFGRLQNQEHELIFDEQPAKGSVVLVSLDYLNERLGFLAIASHDAEHFDPRMDTLLISQLRTLVAKLIVKLSK